MWFSICLTYTTNQNVGKASSTNPIKTQVQTKLLVVCPFVGAIKHNFTLCIKTHVLAVCESL